MESVEQAHVAFCGKRDSCDEDERACGIVRRSGRAGPTLRCPGKRALRIARGRSDARRQRLADLAELSVGGDAVATGCADRRRVDVICLRSWIGVRELVQRDGTLPCRELRHCAGLGRSELDRYSALLLPVASTRKTGLLLFVRA